MIFSAIFVTLAVVTVSVVLWLALQSVIREQVDQRLDTQMAALANALGRDTTGRLSLSAPSDAPPFDRPGSGWYWQVEGEGQRLTSRSLRDRTIDAPPPDQDFLQMMTGRPAPGQGRDRGRSLYLRQSVRLVEGVPVTITVSAPQAALSDPVLRALMWLAPAMLLLGAVLMVGTLWQIRFGLRPLRAMGADIDAINRGEAARLTEQPVVELAPLTTKINALISANDERLAATRLQFANLAHGLKTPVASLLLALDDDNDPPGVLRRLVMRIEARIKHHLSATRRAMVATGSFARSNLAQIVGGIEDALRMIHADRGIALQNAVKPDLFVACDGKDLEEMLGNLMDNACKWAQTRVLVSAERTGPLVKITVDDDGPGIPEDRRHAVLLPGVREDERVAGDGFGLAIVTELAGLYGGSLTLEQASPAGLRAVLLLPAAQTDSRS